MSNNSPNTGPDTHTGADRQPERPPQGAQPRSSAITALLVLILITLCILVILILAPEVLRSLNPVEQAAETIEEELQSRLNPTPTIRPSPSTIIRQIRSLSRLETASFTVEKVITAESGQDALAFLFGDRLLLVAHGQVIAGVDLEQMQDDAIIVTQDDRVIVAMPPAEVFVVTLDNEQSYVYDRETGFFGLNSELETEARQAAEEEILTAALEGGILDMAEDNARAYLERLILGFGFREVIFLSDDPIPTATPSVLPVTVGPATATP
jgi:hypothetical protein